MAHTRTTVPLRPTRINWICITGPVYRFDKVDPHCLVLAGLIDESQIPGIKPRSGWSNNEISIHRCQDGAVNMSIDAAAAISRDISFKRMLGMIVSDFRLTLVRGEHHG